MIYWQFLFLLPMSRGRGGGADYLAGLKVNVRGLNRLRHNVWLEPMKFQHITCSFLGSLKFERYLKKRVHVLE